jgi:hypothetical protein
VHHNVINIHLCCSRTFTTSFNRQKYNIFYPHPHLPTFLNTIMHVFLTFLIVLRVLNVSAAVRTIQSNNVRHELIHFRFSTVSLFCTTHPTEHHHTCSSSVWFIWLEYFLSLPMWLIETCVPYWEMRQQQRRPEQQSDD